MADAQTDSALLFRPASPSELPALEPLHATWAREVFAHRARSGSAPSDALRRALRHPLRLISPGSPDHRCVVAEAELSIVGLVATLAVTAPAAPSTPARQDAILAAFLALTPVNSLHICSLAVLPSHRRRGIARRLLKIAEIEARALALPQVSVTVFGARPAAGRLFTAAGFTCTRRVRPPERAARDTLGDILLFEKAVRD